MLDLASYAVFFLVTALGFTLICLGLSLQGQYVPVIADDEVPAEAE